MITTKIVAINSCNYGSTGRIMLQIADYSRSECIEYYTSCGDGSLARKIKTCNHIYIGNRVSRKIHVTLSKYTGFNGCFSINATYKFLKKLDEIQPDVIHLHNLHNSYINLKMLFSYIKRRNIKTVWTLHDCWAFTGKCPHFTLAECKKWIDGCCDCGYYKEYPEAIYDNTKKMWQLKKRWFTGVQNLVVVTPSMWLANLVKQSYLNEYQVCVINNGIDKEVFKPIKSNFREKYYLQGKVVILGVAFCWGIKKGLDVFLKLAKLLDDDYRIVLVGTNDEIDKMLPESIISIHRTNNQRELAEIYTAADVFLNPTREENYPTVNMESLACGTPVITFNTGGSPEIINGQTGIVLEKNTVEAAYEAIIKMRNKTALLEDDCIKRSNLFDMNSKFDEYIKLYLS